MSKKLLFLLDGMALAYRAHFAFIRSNLQNSEGIPTGPIMGFANTLEKLLEEFEPTHIAVAWDTHAPTIRHEWDEQYKANRPPQPDELKVGIPIIKEMVDYWGIQNLEMDGYEADDIIGTIASDANEDDVDVYLVTPDKDFMQLVHDHIKMYKPNNSDGGFDLIGREEVKAYFGVYPEKVIDVLAIIGDTSDNIPGVPGIGKKGAPKLIDQYGSLEEVIEAAPSITAKRQRENLIEYKDQALLAKKMVTILTDVPEIKDWEHYGWEGANKNDLGAFFKRMEFRTLTRKYLGEEVEKKTQATTQKSDQGNLFGDAHQSASSAGNSGPETSFNRDECQYELVTDLNKLKDCIQQSLKADVICFDTETDAADPIRAGLVGISICHKTGEAYYVPVNVEGVLPQNEVLDAFRELFASEQITKVAHNFKFDYLMLHRNGLHIKGPAFDTMVAAYLIDSSQKLKMDELSQKYLDYTPIPITKLIGEGKKQKSMADIPAEEVYEYACEDADITLRLYEILKDRLAEDELGEIAMEVDFPLIAVLAEMEEKGIKVDTGKLEAFSEELLSDLQDLQAQIYEKAGEEFNVNSPQQLGQILFEKLGLPSGKKTKTGRYSTSESVLSDLAVKYELPSLVLDFRQISKLKSTYVDALPELINPDTGRIHSEFNQTVAATGRLSSSNPNLQNIPIRTSRGREIRKAFIPEEGFSMLSADYSQVELRVIAAISGDEAMKQAFLNDEDIHARTAKEVFGLSTLEEVTADQRRKAKEVNFGIPYGVSAYGLASRLGLENVEGKEMIDSYFREFPKVLEYINETKEFAREHGYVKTLMGRRRYIPDIKSGNWNVRGFAERVAINMPIQGTAADIIKLAMIDIHQFLEKEAVKSRMLLQVHDELVFELHEDEKDWLPEILKQKMEEAYTMDVPLKVEMGTGNNWLEAH